MPIRRRITNGIETFGGRVSRLRYEQRRSKSELANLVGVSTTCVWNWEEGNTHPRPGNFDRLAAALDTTVEYLENGASSAQQSEGNAANLTPGQIGSLPDLIQKARTSIAELAGLSPSQVRITLDYGG